MEGDIMVNLKVEPTKEVIVSVKENECRSNEIVLWANDVPILWLERSGNILLNRGSAIELKDMGFKLHDDRVLVTNP